MPAVNKLAPHGLLQAGTVDLMKIAMVLLGGPHARFSRSGRQEGPGLLLSLWLC